MICGLFGFLQLTFAFQPEPSVLRKVFEDALERRQQTYGADDPRTAQAARDLGFFLKQSGDTKAAAAAFAHALEIDEAAFGPNSRQTLAGVVALASVSASAEAEKLLRRVLVSSGVDAPLAVVALSTLGDLRLAADDRVGAAGYWRLALRQAESLYGADAVQVGKILNSLAGVAAAPEAVELLQRATAISQQVWGEQHPETATSEANLARGLLRAGRAKDSADEARRSVAAFEATLGPQHPRVAVAVSILGDALRRNRDLRGAEASYRRALEIDRVALGSMDPQTLEDARALTALLREGGWTK